VSKHPTLGDDAAIDIDRLLVSRLLVQANSGGGKSYALRRLLEQTFGLCQHIVIDPEGEFHTLREKYDYILAGKGGEAAATVETAPLLARRLLELGVSAIIDISELGVDRPAFVTRFIEALMSAPRELWRPLLIVVDEAHRYCPQGVTPRQPSQRDEDEPLTPADSAAAVISLMDAGRKRGFCGVLATQRISKLSKDATAECNNKMIGRCVEIDAKRAGDELGLTGKQAILQLRKLKAGQFFIFGPALSDEVRVIQVGSVETTHPEAGKAAPPPTPPRDKVRQVLGRLKDLPAEAAEGDRVVEKLRARIDELEAKLIESKSFEPEPERVEVPLLTDGQLKALKDAIEQAHTITDDVTSVIENLGSVLVDIKATIELNGRPSDPSDAIEKSWSKGDPLHHAYASHPPVTGVHRGNEPRHTDRANGTPKKNAPKAWPAPPPAPGGKLVPAQQRIVDTIATIEKLGIESTRTTLAAWLGQHPNTKGLVNNLGALRSAGLVDGYTLTADGRRASRPNIPKSHNEVREILLRPLKPAQRRIIEAVEQLGAADRDELAEILGKHPNTKGLVNDIGALRGRALVTPGWPLKLEQVFKGATR
jgi:hypothetical protein